MRKRLLVLTGVVLVLLAVAAGLHIRAWSQQDYRDRFVDAKHYHKIEAGMPWPEVEAILGRPPDGYAGEWAYWKADGVTIEVEFKEGRAGGTTFAQDGPRPPSLVKQLQDWWWGP